jgi:hypothetical protein
MNDAERQRAYNERFAEFYGKPIDELTDRERKSTAVFEAHRKAVRAILSPVPRSGRFVYEGKPRDYLQVERERFEARMRRIDRLELIALVLVGLAVLVTAFLRLS